MAKPLEYNATLVERVDVTDALTLFRVQPDQPPTERPWFVPGQYCVLGANNAEKPELGSVRRSMSIASAPEDDGPIEFYVRFVSKPESENPLTHLLWKLKAGDRMYMRPVAAGVFTVKDTIGLALYLKRNDLRPRQVQDFIPTPMAVATTMYHTGIDPLSGKPVYTARELREKRMMKALIFWWDAQHWPLAREALRAGGRQDLIGRGPQHLIPPEGAADRRLAARQPRSAQRPRRR